MKEKQKTFELEPVQQLLPADAQQRVMDQLYQFMELEHLYESAIREVKTKLEILDSEFKTKYDHNPIHHLEDRVKSPQSILEKLNRKGIPFSCDNAKRELNDIAGVRVVCNYIDDIYTVADLLTAQDDVKLIKRKDYIQNPKPNGYRSLHLVIETPVYLSEKKELVHVEVQIRTIAMNFWATLSTTSNTRPTAWCQLTLRSSSRTARRPLPPPTSRCRTSTRRFTILINNINSLLRQGVFLHTQPNFH